MWTAFLCSNSGFLKKLSNRAIACLLPITGPIVDFLKKIAQPFREPIGWAIFILLAVDFL
jgi:hypothetical protein